MDVLVSTLNIAAIYGLIAIGLSLAFSGLGFLNLAHGATFSLAGFGAYWAAQYISGNAAVVIIAGVLVGAAAGAVTWLVVFVPLDGRVNWDARSITATLAISLITANALLAIHGPYSAALPDIFGASSFEVGDAVITANRLGAIISAVVILGLVVLALVRSRIGLSVRALTQNVEGARLVGIDRRTSAIAILVVSGALAGLAAVLVSQTILVSPSSGFTPLVKGMIVALLGGLGSIPGTVTAALLVGATEALTARYIGPSWVLVTLFALIAVVLLLRPRGVAGVLETNRE